MTPLHWFMLAAADFLTPVYGAALFLAAGAAAIYHAAMRGKGLK